MNFHFAKIERPKTGKAPEEIVIFAAGEIELEGSDPAIMDEIAAAEVIAGIERRGVDIVIDYEHATLSGEPAPAAGWLPHDGFNWDPDRGLVAKTRWTAKAKRYLEASQYRYHSPVFYVDSKTRRITALHSVALTNSPRTNNIMPIAAKQQEDKKMEFTKQVIAALGISTDADEAKILEAAKEIKALADKPPVEKPVEVTVEVIPGAVLEALKLSTDAKTDEVVASIRAIRQEKAGMIDRAEFDALKQQIAKRNAEDAVAAAMIAGKITPDMREEWLKTATDNPELFARLVATMPVIVPVDPLPKGTPNPAGPDDLTKDETVMNIAAKLGVSAEDLKKYGGAE